MFRHFVEGVLCMYVNNRPAWRRCAVMCLCAYSYSADDEVFGIHIRSGTGDAVFHRLFDCVMRCASSPSIAILSGEITPGKSFRSKMVNGTPLNQGF